MTHCVCSCAKYREGDGVEAGSNGGAGGEGEDGPHGGFMVRGGEGAAAPSAGESGRVTLGGARSRRSGS